MPVSISGAGSVSGIDLNPNMGLTHIATQSFNSVSNISFDNCFSDIYENYRIMFWYTSTADQGMNFRLRASSSDFTDNTYIRERLSVTGTTVSASVSTSTGWLAAMSGRSTLSTADMTIYRPHKTSHTGMIYLNQYGDIYYYSGVGLHQNTGVMDGFTFISPTGTISGTTRVYGYEDGA